MSEKCQECEEKKPEFFCYECNNQVCKGCRDVIHSLKKRKDHKIIPLSEYLKQSKTTEKSGFCQTHTSEQVIAYCVTCEDPICLSCALGSHDGHERKNLVDAQPDTLKEFQQLLDESKSTNKDFHSFQENLTKDNEKTNQEIQKYFKDLMEILQSVEKSTLESLKNHHSSNENLIQARVSVLEQFIKRMTEEKSFVEQLKIKKQIKQHLKSLVVEDKESVAVSDAYLFTGDSQVSESIKKSAELKTKDSELTLLQRINVSPQNTFVDGSVETTMSNFDTTFVLHVMDKYKKPCIVPKSIISVEIKNSTESYEDVKSLDLDVHEEEINPIIVQIEPSVFKINYNLFIAGKYTMSVMVNKTHILRSPFTVECLPITLRREKDFDKNGFFYFIATNERKKDWKCPLEQGFVSVKVSSSKFGSISKLFYPGENEFYTEDKPGSNLAINIENSGFKLSLSHYTLKHGYNFGNFMMKNWNIEGSSDGILWKIIKEHKDDSNLAAAGYSSYTWSVEQTEPFSHFRITMTGQNSKSTNHLMLSGIEFYGTLTRHKKVSSMKL